MRTNKRKAWNFQSNNIVTRVVVVILSMLMALMGVATLFMQETYAESEPDIQADSALVVSASTGEVVYSLHSDRKLPMGGLAKIMAAMVVIDRMHDGSEFKNRITITADVASKGKLFQKGEKVSVRDLMAAMLIENSDEAAVALAVYSADTVSAFVDAMNAKAQEMDLEGTHYTTVSGKYDALQYTTVPDTATLIQKALRYRTISKYLNTENQQITVESSKSRNLDLKRNETFRYSGLETGYTVNSGTSSKHKNSFALADRDGMQLFVVIFGTTDKKVDSNRKGLLDYGYQHVTRHVIVKADKQVGKIKVRHGSVTRVPVYTKSKGYVYVPKEGSDSLIRTQTVIDDHLNAPLKAGDKAGEYRIYVADELTGTVDLIVKEDVETGWFPSYAYISNGMTILVDVILLCILVLIIRVRNIKRRKRKLAEKRRRQQIREIAMREYEIEQDRKRRNWTYH